ncbi:MIP/aquaporin family protein [Flavobacterium oreochromis]|uniref:MIP/aquaporin family protein n=1 Tax=Flavobacterium oreochromis TaxID=2906078 RepID=A0ABW8P680_9FLAO|nr:MIP/aquaporin family protein [Flavobacterium oreochromis]OWP77790.1 aquaporin [Flavobacterium oreochromis]POR21385.1 aquaporin [Flavobacterium columnare]QYS87860.1 aquaporin family protein [Flavobacterium oreochromis]
MNPFLAEFIGTMILLLLGNGVVANVVLNKTKGNNGGWIVITFGWAIAVFVGVYMTASSSGAHLNPIVSMALAIQGKLTWTDLPFYVLSQFLGAMVGSLFVYFAYKQHYDETEDIGLIKATFCNEPAIRNVFHNLISEIIATFALVIGILFLTGPKASLGSLDALPVALLVLGIGLSLGGATGYAINPARDLGPRILYAILPIKHKGSPDWKYSWIPVLGPVLGSLLAVCFFSLLN